ncbi:16070_t:CDS:1, partial [Dentiscutata heterogama]
MVKIKEIKKRQNNLNACKLALTGGTKGQLLCCEDNSTACLATPPSCSSTNKLWQCWDIRGFDPCIARTDAPAVCSHQDGIYCLKGKTDLPYNQNLE